MKIGFAWMLGYILGWWHEFRIANQSNDANNVHVNTDTHTHTHTQNEHLWNGNIWATPTPAFQTFIYYYYYSLLLLLLPYYDNETWNIVHFYHGYSHFTWSDFSFGKYSIYVSSVKHMECVHTLAKPFSRIETLWI